MQILLTYSVLVAVAYLVVVAAAAVVSALRTGGRREDTGDEHDAVAGSRFTIPVSVIVPVTGGSGSIGPSIAALLEMNYPEFEVIVVADGAAPLIEQISAEWQLEAREFFYRRTIETAEVRRIYKSGRDQRLMVIDKAAGRHAGRRAGKGRPGVSDALNCGVNVARYRYVMSVDPEVIFDRDALLRVMSAALRDPANVVGASSHVERGADTQNGAAAVSRHSLTGLFQRLASARALMDSRLAWRYLGAGLGPAGAVVVWRRDGVIKLKGFSTTAADAELDMMFRLQTQEVDGGGRFNRGMDVFGHIGPQPISGALKLAGRRQQTAFEIVWSVLTGRARGLDVRTLGYFVASEILTPLAHLWIVAATIVGAAVGTFTWTTVILAVIVLSFGNAAVSTAALLLRGSTSGAPEESELRQLIAATPLDFIVYRPVLATARIAAAISFLMP